ncbi:hypothetical protein BGZ93_001944 [Podila epicladia]|nr:hypothetical protein BGZ93_001944 [Podila epicladia]
MASSFEGKQEVLDEPSSSSTYFPISPQKAEFASDEDQSSVTASEAATETPVQLFHKPPTKQFVLIMVALSLCVFLASLDQIIVSTSIPAITREYHSLGDISWLGTAYMLTATAFQPLYGKFSDIFGRKSTMLFANFLFLVGSAISGWATSMTMLIVGRGVAGVGAGGLMAMVFIILSDMLDMRERGKYLGFIGAIFSFSSVIAISILFIYFNLNLPTPKGSFKDKVKRIDFLGSSILLIAVILILLPLSWGGSKYEWSSGIIIGLLVAGFAAAFIFVLVEWKIPNEPILPVHLYKIRNLWSTYGSLFFSGMSFFGILFYLPIYFQVVKNESATIGGLETVPFVFGIVITSISSGIWVLKKGTFHFFPAVGNLFFITGASLCLLFQKDTQRVVTIFVLLVCGLGMGFTMQASTLAVQAAVKPKYMATVTTSVQFVRSLGQVFGVAIVGTIFNNKLESSLLERFPNDPRIMSVTHDYENIYEFYKAEQIGMIYDSFVYGLHYAFYCCIACCFMAFIMSCFIQHKELKTNANQKPELTVEV